MQRSAGQRTAAIVLAVLAQSALITPYILSRRRDAAPASESPAMVFIQPVRTTEIRPAVRASRRGTTPAAPALIPAGRDTLTEASIAGPDALPQPESQRIAPRIDWYGQMESVAQDAIRRKAELEEHGNLLDSKPSTLQLPGPSTEVPAIIAERLGNGDLITRYRVTDDTTVICEHRQIPLSQHFEALARSAPPLCRTSVNSHVPDLTSAKPGYLRKPLPRPRAAKDPE